MLKEQKTLPNSRVKLTITASAEQFRHAFGHELEKVSEGVKVQGFRPGKAPKAKILQQIGRQRIEAGALDHAISDAYFETVQSENIIPVENPSIDVEKYEAPADSDSDDKVVVTFTAEVDIMPQVTVDGYAKIKIKKELKTKEVADDEVQKVIHYLRNQKANLKDLPANTELKNGMWADLWYEGSVEGVKRTDMKNEHHPLVIGEGQLIPGFEEQILGMKPGDEKDISLTFPKDYHTSELSGKKADFKVKVHELKEVDLPAKDEKFAEEYGHPSFEKLEEAIRKNLHEEKQQESKQEIEEEVLDQLVKLAKFETPVSLVETELDRMYKDAQERLKTMNFNWDMYLGQVKKTAEEVKEEMRPQAEKNVKVGLALGKVIQEEELPEGQKAGRNAIDRLVEIATS